MKSGPASSLSLRTLFERSSRHIVLRRRLPVDLGRQRLYVSPDASLRLWLPLRWAADPLLFRWVRELVQPGDVVWDIGANVGLFTFAAAHRVGSGGSVLAIEPDDWITSLLHRSVATRPPGSGEVTVLTCATAECHGLAEFSVAKRGRAGSHLNSTGGSSQTGGSREQHRVLTVSLDWLLERQQPPDLVKIDVEGAEVACLAGGERLLSEARPTLLCEVSEPAGGEVAARLFRHGYVLFDASAPPEARRPLSRPEWNTLAVPEERLGEESAESSEVLSGTSVPRDA